MPKSTITFVCTECGGESLRWAGPCPHCRAWNTLQEFQVRKAAKDSKPRPLEPVRAQPLESISVEGAPRQRLAWGELNRVLGGGIVPGSMVLIGGEPGVGKSTLLLSVAHLLARQGGPVLYVSGEESERQIKLRGERLGISGGGLFLMAETSLERILEHV